MTYLATITSKRQLTLPVALFKKLQFKEGEKVIVQEKDGKMEIESARLLVERLAGSLKVPPRFRKVDVDRAIEIAKSRYFSERLLKNTK